MIVGEAVAGLSGELRERYPYIKWTSIKAFRNIIVHAYFNLSLPIVWTSATSDMPMLREALEKILTEDFGKSD